MGALLVGSLLAACAPDTPTGINSGETIAQQLLRLAPFLRDCRFSNLLTFESQDDALFVSAPHGGSISKDHAFTGHGSYQLDSSATQCSVKLASLLAGRPFPGEWAMVGGWMCAAGPMTVRMHIDGDINVTRSIDLPANLWTPVFVDLPTGSISGPTPPLLIDLPSPHGMVWLDDVVLVDNHQTLFSPPKDQPSGWTITRAGTVIAGESPSAFHFSLTSADVVPHGWVVDETNAARARFHTNDGKTLTVDSDGRSYSDGQYKPMSAIAREPQYAAAHEHPASLEVGDNMGRVDRNSPGDANNDGYNETTGSYRILATGPRCEVHFAPAAGAPAPRPILEFTGLPFGKVLATLEGRLIESSQRTADGHVLIELPATIDRPVTVDVRIESN